MIAWVVVILVLLILEFVTMSLYGICGAIGAICALIGGAFGLNIFLQVAIMLAVTFFLMVVARPVGMKYVNQMHHESRMQQLVGRDAIVVYAVDNSQGVGVVTVDGKQYSAKSHRPNAIIREGSVVRIVAMNQNVAIVDDKRRNNS